MLVATKASILLPAALLKATATTDPLPFGTAPPTGVVTSHSCSAESALHTRIRPWAIGSVRASASSTGSHDADRNACSTAPTSSIVTRSRSVWSGMVAYESIVKNRSAFSAVRVWPPAVTGPVTSSIAATVRGSTASTPSTGFPRAAMPAAAS
jgi:hypothetical protein